MRFSITVTFYGTGVVAKESEETKQIGMADDVQLREDIDAMDL